MGWYKVVFVRLGREDVVWLEKVDWGWEVKGFVWYVKDCEIFFFWYLKVIGISLIDEIWD